MKLIKPYIIFMLALIGIGNYSLQAQYDEKYRPQFHFSPEEGWIGDPDGLVHTEDQFHLFWWGHAVSDDLVYWEELPYPMKGDDGSFSYFSGSVAVDKENTSGFGKNSMIAAYTRHFPGDSLSETQALSISNDGINFYYYEDNPVLDIGEVFFRDPQVFWYEPEEKWVMVVSLPDVQKIHIYESKNLKDWNYLSEFEGLGAQNSFWECPDLFQLPIRGEENLKKWVIFIGRGPNRVQYFLGDFNGKEFIADDETTAYLKEGQGLNGEPFQDFESNLNGWNGNSKNLPSNPDEFQGFLGASLWSSKKFNKDASLLSPTFIIEKNAINFLIAGGKDTEKLSINLIINGDIVKSSTGDNTNIFKWDGWDVSSFKGKEGRIEIKDRSQDEEWGFIGIDHILFSDELKNQKLEHALWLDYGPDFYAARTWRDYDNTLEKTYMIGWMGNWEYARDVPSSWGKGFQSLPRELEIHRLPHGNRIVQKPVNKLKVLRKNKYELSDINISGSTDLEGFDPSRNTYEIKATFSTKTSASFGFILLKGDGRELILEYQPNTSNLILDRTNTTDYISDPEFSEKFASKMTAVVPPVNDEISLHILVDQASIEVFANEGEKVISSLTFPGNNQKGIELFSRGGKVILKQLKAWELSSIWQKD